MIKIIIKRKKLILNKDITIKYTLTFPDTVNDVLPNATVQWFNIPICKTNDDIFNYSRFVEVKNKIRLFENVIFEIAGVSQIGLLIVKSANSESYKVSFTTYPFPKDFKDELITNIDYNDINIGNDTDTIIATAKTESLKQYPDADICFPMIRANNFYDEEQNITFRNFMNYYIFDNYLKNEYYLNGFQNFNCLVPHFYLFATISKIFNSIDYNIKGNLFQDADLQKLVIFNNYALDKIRYEFYVKTSVINEKTIPAVTYDLREIVFDTEIDEDNVFNLNTGTYTAQAEAVLNINVTFDAKVPDIVGNLALIFFGINLDINENQYEYYQTDSTKDPLWHHYSFNFSINIEIANIGKTFKFYLRSSQFTSEFTIVYKNLNVVINPIAYNNVNIFDGNINLKNHLPKISVSNFINNIAKLLSVAVFYDTKNKQIEFQFLKDIINNDKNIDLTDCLENDSEEIELYTNTYSQTMNQDDDIDSRSELIGNYIGSGYSVDIPNPAIANDLFYVKNLNKWILCNLVKKEDEEVATLKWKSYKDNFENININDKEAQKIDITIKTLPMNFNYGYAYTMTYPEYNKKGTSKAFGSGQNDFDFKLLFYHGFHENSKNWIYPLASSTRYNTKGDTLSNIALRLNGEDGLFANYSEKYYNYLQEHDIVKMKLHVNTDIFHKIHKLFAVDSDIRKVRVINKNYIPIKFEFEINMFAFTNCLTTLR